VRVEPHIRPSRIRASTVAPTRACTRLGGAPDVLAHLDPDPVQSTREPFALVPHTACVADLPDAAYRVPGAVLYFALKGMPEVCCRKTTG